MLKNILKSKNKKAFLTGAVILIVLTVVFIFREKRYSTSSYISFGFLWLSVIVSVSLYYLVPKEKSKISRFFYPGILIYLLSVVVINTLFIKSLSIYALIGVDFFVTFVVLLFGMTLIYIGRNNE